MVSVFLALAVRLLRCQICPGVHSGNELEFNSIVTAHVEEGLITALWYTGVHRDCGYRGALVK